MFTRHYTLFDAENSLRILGCSTSLKLATFPIAHAKFTVCMTIDACTTSISSHARVCYLHGVWGMRQMNDRRVLEIGLRAKLFQHALHHSYFPHERHETNRHGMKRYFAQSP
jgi:hypothetical protein